MMRLPLRIRQHARPKIVAAKALGLRDLPTTLIFDREGRERARLEGGTAWASDAAVATVKRLAG